MFPLDVLATLIVPALLLLLGVSAVTGILLLLGVAWETIKRIGHALAWFAVIVSVCLFVFGLAVGISPDAPDIVVDGACILVLSLVALVWLRAIRRQWSLKWLLIPLVFVLWPSGVALTVVSMIGVGKLIIWGVGRGNTMASSRLQEPAVAVRPGSLVEHTSYE